MPHPEQLLSKAGKCKDQPAVPNTEQGLDSAFMPCVQIFAVIKDYLGFRIRSNEFGSKDGCCSICDGDTMAKNLIKVFLGDVRIPINRSKPSDAKSTRYLIDKAARDGDLLLSAQSNPL
jgi:hypothetical protein